ncbi:acetyl-CoA carboxylase, carboxyltransferase subunit beta [Alloiococcus sp. CFN-8]|uniref:acetyl-CoA carboxylase, carboxyltransferase subunit beta n=1 Tax=Alloiococcus sp. CFN-8 TaxID=3416081 RepID=UPI003CEB3DDC
MLLRGIFKKNKNELEKGGRIPKVISSESSELAHTCPKCSSTMAVSELYENFNMCKCGWHYRVNARQRIDYIADRSSFKELFEELQSTNPLDFPDYESKLKNAALACREKEAVICGTCTISGNPCAIFIMEPFFMLGSMGTVVGEKITRTFEYAKERNLPVIGYTVSGGARMQEGILSLMQMAKISGAVKLFSDAGGLYIAVLTDPTTGGVTASFAMEGDIIIAEPMATVGFAGARVIEQVTGKRLPEGFQKSEFLLDHGFVDMIVPRNNQKAALKRLLALHKRGDN